jgi:phospholipase/carboxylesterase
MSITRRRFTGLAGSTLAALAVAPASRLEALFQPRGDGRLKARPGAGVKTKATGRVPLGFGDSRDGFLQMPAAVPATPMPLLVLLHGAGSSGDRQFGRFGTIPSDAGVAVLAIDSRYGTWDGILGNGMFGPDVAFIDRALDKVFGMVAVDPARLTIGGFSDGASYGLSLGLINGDLFPKIAAFSAGFVIRGEAHGKPRVFLSHGTSDDVLPIDQCGRPIAADLRKRGYDVTFREFAGKHEVPPAVATEGFTWIAAAK